MASANDTPTVGRLFASFMAGGLSGTVAKTAVAPFDRTKILFQVSERRFSFAGVGNELRRIVADEGARALFKGNLATVARVLPYSGIQLMCFDQYKEVLMKSRVKALVLQGKKEQASMERTSGMDRVLAGAMAGGTSVVLTYPLDLMRARLAIQIHYHHYEGLGHAFQTAYKEEGLLAMYRGMAPTLLGILPYAAISFYTYDSIKARYRDRYNAAPGVYAKLAGGALAGALGQSAAYPMDVIRRRMQTANFKGDGVGVQAASEVTLVATARHIARTEGWRGLFKGLSLNWVKGPVAVSISFTVFDALKSAWGIESLGDVRERRAMARQAARQAKSGQAE